MDRLAREVAFTVQWKVFSVITKVFNTLLPKNADSLFLKEALSDPVFKQAAFDYSINVSWIPALFEGEKSKKNKYYRDRVLVRVTALRNSVLFFDHLTKETRKKEEKCR